MKKTFALKQPGKDDRRVLELVQNEIGKYLKREKRKAPPADDLEWEFACRVGADEATAVTVAHVPYAIGDMAATGAEAVYVEIIASTRQRPKIDRTPIQPEV